MNKFDSKTVNTLTALDDAVERHPDKGDGPAKLFGVFARPNVETGPIVGQAIAWTPNYGLIEWKDSKGLVHREWFPAVDIRRT